MSDQVILDRLRASVDPALAQLKELRESIDVAGDLHPKEIWDRVIDTRGAMTRAEEILHNLLVLRVRAMDQKAEAKAALDDAWDKATTTTRAFGFDAPAPRERYAKYNLATVPQQIRYRYAERVLMYLDGAVEIARLYLRGIEGVRNDLVVQHRLISVENALER